MAKPYTGQVYVLTDASNSSATYAFERTIQTEHLGTLIGQPSGGNKRGTNGGAFFFLRLPRSGIEIDLPLIGYFPATAEPNEGLQPDILVKQPVADDTSGDDADLNIVEIVTQKRSVH